LFGDRYKAVVVDGESPYYYETLWDYIHLNPGRAGLVDVSRGQSVLDYPWSSLAGGYALMPYQRAKWLAAEHGLATMGVEDTADGREKMAKRLDERVTEERERSGLVTVDADADKRGSHLRRGWYWGKQAFAEKLMKLGEEVIGRKRKARGYDASPERQAHGEQNALALLDEGLRLANLSADELAGHRCTEPRRPVNSRKAAVIELRFRHDHALGPESLSPRRQPSKDIAERQALEVFDILPDQLLLPKDRTISGHRQRFAVHDQHRPPLWCRDFCLCRRTRKSREQ
jgi:hypothetical protein